MMNCSNFANEIYSITISSIEESKQKKILEQNNNFIQKQSQRRNDLYLYLTHKYYNDIKKCMLNNAKLGHFQLYYNFYKEDFKANFPGLGTPFQVCKNWLHCLTQDNHSYLDGNETLMGIDFIVYNNGALTTKFSWQNIENFVIKPENKGNTEKIDFLFTPPPHPPPPPSPTMSTIGPEFEFEFNNE